MRTVHPPVTPITKGVLLADKPPSSDCSSGNCGFCDVHHEGDLSARTFGVQCLAFHRLAFTVRRSPFAVQFWLRFGRSESIYLDYRWEQLARQTVNGER